MTDTMKKPVSDFSRCHASGFPSDEKIVTDGKREVNRKRNFWKKRQKHPPGRKGAFRAGELKKMYELAAVASVSCMQEPRRGHPGYLPRFFLLQQVRRHPS